MSFTKMLSNVGLRLQPCRTPTKGVNVTLIINDRVTKYLDEHNIIHNSQIVFRKGYRTSDHVFVLKTLIELNTKNDKKGIRLLCRLSKAYDTIWRNGLFHKLMKYAFSQKIICPLKSMYDRVVLSVKVKLQAG